MRMYFRCICILAITSSFAFADRKESGAVFGNESSLVSTKDMPALTQQALRGDPDAARRLGIYFRQIKLDLEKSYFWMSIAAENGDLASARSVGLMLSDEGFLPLQEKLKGQFPSEPAMRERAEFWLRKAADGGVPYAKSDLYRIVKDSNAGK